MESNVINNQISSSSSLSSLLLFLFGPTCIRILSLNTSSAIYFQVTPLLPPQPQKRRTKENETPPYHKPTPKTKSSKRSKIPVPNPRTRSPPLFHFDVRSTRASIGPVSARKPKNSRTRDPHAPTSPLPPFGKDNKRRKEGRRSPMAWKDFIGPGEMACSRVSPWAISENHVTTRQARNHSPPPA